MLVLSRKEGESIKIGKDVIVTVVGFRQGRVQLGIQAPREMEVWRTEIAPENMDDD